MVLDLTRNESCFFASVATFAAKALCSAVSLPTARSARFSSGLGVLDFMKRTTFVQCDADSLAAIGPAAITLADAEGLDAHARSIAIRLGQTDDN